MWLLPSLFPLYPALWIFQVFRLFTFVEAFGTAYSIALTWLVHIFG